MNRFKKMESAIRPAHRFLNGLRPNQVVGTVQEDLTQGLRSAAEFIGKNPLLSLSVGFVAGAIFGYWWKRR